MNSNTINALRKRRSRYNLTNKSTLTNKELETLLTDIIKLTPTAFNSQAGRVVLLLNQNHTKLWDIVKGNLKKIVPSKNYAQTEQKLTSFQKAYGTILFFEDMETIEALQAKFPTYHKTFAIWSNEQSGMLQLAVWTALSENNMGSSLQHYNPLIDDEVKSALNLPNKWKLMAQMPFGVSLEEPTEKEKLAIDSRLKVII